jgi:hypothetical protein
MSNEEDVNPPPQKIRRFRHPRPPEKDPPEPHPDEKDRRDPRPVYDPYMIQIRARFEEIRDP